MDIDSYTSKWVKAKGRTLVLGKNVKNTETFGRFFYKKKFQSHKFFELAKKKRQEYVAVYDVSFSSYLYKSELSRFYTYISRILNYKGRLYGLVLSDESEECRRCPVRRWTYIDGHYTRFITKKELKEFVEVNFRLEKLEKKKLNGSVYFEFTAINDMRKF